MSNKYRFCPSCGEQLMPNAKFCHNCGKVIEQETTNDAQDTTIIINQEHLQNFDRQEKLYKGAIRPQKARNLDEYEDTVEVINEENEEEILAQFPEEEQNVENYEEEEEEGLGVIGKVLISLIVILAVILLFLLYVFFFKSGNIADTLGGLWPFGHKTGQVEPTKPTTDQKNTNTTTNTTNQTTVAGNNFKEMLNDYLTKNNLKETDVTDLKLEGLNVSVNNKQGFALKEAKNLDFGSLANVSNLTIKQSELENLDAIKAMSGLKNLTLENNAKLKDIKVLEGLKTLTSVTLSGNNISDYTSLKGVENINLTQNKTRVEGSKQLEITTDDLRKRTSPDSSSKNNIIEGGVKKGEFYFIFDQKQDDANGLTWYRIGSKEWVASKDDWTKVHQ